MRKRISNRFGLQVTPLVVRSIEWKLAKLIFAVRVKLLSLLASDIY